MLNMLRFKSKSEELNYFFITDSIDTQVVGHGLESRYDKIPS